MNPLLTAFLMVVVAEMGDKTQLLAMAMAAKYRAGQVMAGVLFATVLNHALAVLAGTYLADFIPMDAVRIVAALSFLGFGLWTLRGDKLDGEEKRVSRYGPVLTVTIAFFLAEMGDKTQLATVAIAAQYYSPVAVLIGTTLGMLVADGLGIWAGDFVARRLSSHLVKLLSAGVFILFGFYTLFGTLGGSLRTVLILVGLAVVLAGIIYKMGWLRGEGESVADLPERAAGGETVR